MSRALEPGDRVVFFSDGIVEAENAEGEQFGEERLRRSILESRELGPQAALDAVWQALAGFLQSAPHADDMTCVIVSAVRGEEAGAASAAQER
jgi:sigma-B regulation protein RsbU (phosphoserine phosphatase)